MHNCIDQTEHICASIVPIFKMLNINELQKINTLIKKKNYHKGTILFNKGDIAKHLYIVRYGRVKVYEMSEDGRQQIVRLLEPGDFFGELALLMDEQHYLLNAETLEDTGICLLFRDDLKNIMRENAEISAGVMHALTERLANAEKFISNLSLQTIEQRLITWLRIMGEKEGVITPQGIRLTINLPRHELASLFGTTRETLSRKISKLQAEGFIKINSPKQILLLDKLRSYSL
ncbi:Crp/Fnr family transcriptional regulator [Pelosinus sp. UFO1]|uniref:Crp/Fnr family transcriptional regulator n=1 Tax=Pelosinus sp. UFO1 TaxID=484770 RepID=UPI0004D1299F|nr:Crp/Fnr family transcriptional regulator [Pelosinus sp. UFO1]AIF50530.1 transcriptional regulator, Crp/Fnr family [Pelosinus sp. UFO1]